MFDPFIYLNRFFSSFYLSGKGQRIRRYGLVLLLVTFYFILSLALEMVLGVDAPFLFSLFIVILCSWFGGFGPGMLATVLTGILTYYFFLEPKYILIGDDVIPGFFVAFIFVLEGFVISLLSEMRRRNDAQKSQFVGVIAHELKNPLTSINGYAELIQRKAKNQNKSDLAEFALRINVQVKHVIDMINEMLDITKIETGKLTYQDEYFSIQDTLIDIVKDQQVTTDTHTIRVKGKVNAMVYGDIYRIGQVITNIITNAIKYSPNATKVDVAIKKSTRYVTIAVTDYGPGIAKEDQRRLFAPFFRAKKTQSTKGTGIGLFISSQIVSRHKGKLFVTSSLGKGSTFTLQLPIANKKT